MNKFLTIALVIMLAVTSVSLLATKDRSSALPPDSSTGTAAIGGDFELTDIHGKRLRSTDFRGKDMLVFFGFTRCPEICPTTMATISSMLPMLGEKADRIVPVFISIDPAHDTPAQVKEFMSNFDARIVGLTGTDEEVQQVANSYKAFYAQEGEMMNHSTLLYWMDKEGKYKTHFAYTIAPDELAKKLAEGL